MTNSNSIIQFSVSARHLAETVHRSGGLAKASYGGVDSLEGIRAHQRFSTYLRQALPLAQLVSEMPCSADTLQGKFAVKINGRLDNLSLQNEQLTLYEVKSFQGNKLYLPKDGEPVHWAQLYLYAYLLQNSNLEQISNAVKADDQNIALHIKKALEQDSIELILVYAAVDQEDFVYKKRMVSRQEITDFFTATIESYLVKMQSWISWKSIRNESIRQSTFPFPSLRPGQKNMMREVLAILRDRQSLLIQAPTGIGKTMSVLYPAVKALSVDSIQKIFYATAMVATRDIAVNSLEILRKNGMLVRSLVLAAKEKLCLQPDLFCDQTLCPFAVDYYQRLPDAIQELLQVQNITPEIITQTALKHQLCPHELSLDISDFCDVMIGDYNHVFDPQASIRRIFSSSEIKCGILIDEAHNLPSRAREMFSARICLQDILNVKKIILFPAFNFQNKYMDLLESFEQLILNFSEIPLILKTQKKPKENSFFSPGEEKWLIDQNFIGIRKKPNRLLHLLYRLVEHLRLFLDEQRMFEGRQQVLNLWFDFMFFIRIADFYFDQAYLTVFSLDSAEMTNVYLLALDAARHLTEIYEKKHPIIFFSATLSPMHYYHNLLNDHAQNTPSELLSLASPFDESNRLLASLIKFSVRYKDRQQSMPYILKFILHACRKKNGNYLIFVPSFQYLQQVKFLLKKYKPAASEQIIFQDRQMNEYQKNLFLSHFEKFGQKTLLGFAVLGSHFNEGIDLQGEKLSGVFVIGTGLPQISPERELMTQYYAEHFDGGRAFGYQYPGFNRVQQAVGRLIRSEQDIGIAILIDDRYSNPEWNTIFPDDWHLKTYFQEEDLLSDIEIFWSEHAD